jgi:hypothetical protein
MSSAVVPEDIDHIEVLIVVSESQGGSAAALSSEEGIQEVPSDAEVWFCFSAVE